LVKSYDLDNENRNILQMTNVVCWTLLESEARTHQRPLAWVRLFN